MFPRRQFIRSTAALASLGGLYLGIGSTKLSLAIDPFTRPAPGRLRLSLAAYSMRKYMDLKGESGEQEMNNFQFIDYCRSLEIDGAELTSYYFPRRFDSAYLSKLKRYAHVTGITISGGAIRNDFVQRDEAKAARDMEHTKQWIDHYAALGCTPIRIFAGNLEAGDSMEEGQARCARRCEEVCQYAAEKGVMLALENHGGITAKAEGLLGIVRQVNSDAFGINFDSGNFRSTDNPYEELEQIAPYSINAQIKVEMFPNGKRELTDLKRVLDILQNSGYSGWVALEYEAAEEPKEAIPYWIDLLKKHLAS